MFCLRSVTHNRAQFFFFFNDTAPTEIYTRSLHDALPIYPGLLGDQERPVVPQHQVHADGHVHLVLRSEEHTSELQSQFHLVCRLLLEKKKKQKLKYFSLKKNKKSKK